MAQSVLWSLTVEQMAVAELRHLRYAVVTDTNHDCVEFLLLRAAGTVLTIFDTYSPLSRWQFFNLCRKR